MRHRLDELQDALSLATAIPSDALICMTAAGAQLSADVIGGMAREQEETVGQSAGIRDLVSCFTAVPYWYTCCNALGRGGDCDPAH